MRAFSLFGFVLLASAASCKTEPSSAAPSSSASPSTDASVSRASGDAAPAAASIDVMEASAPVRATGNPYVELPPIATDLATFPSPDLYAGFTADDRYLAFSISTCDPCPVEVHYESPGEKAVVLRFSGGEIEETPLEKQVAHDREVKKKIAELGAGEIKDGRKLRGPFPFSDLAFATKTTAGERTGGVALLFGARVIGNPAEKPVFPMHVEISPHLMYDAMPADDRARIAALPKDERDKAIAEWHAGWGMEPPELAYANVTRDGNEIGVVAVSRGSMWFEAGGVARMQTAAFAAQIYNDTGMRHLAAKDYAGASALFERAERQRPSEWLFSYNLACALARAKDARSNDALGRALNAAGDKRDTVKARAKKDADFDAVRGEPWFAEAVR